MFGIANMLRLKKIKVSFSKVHLVENQLDLLHNKLKKVFLSLFGQMMMDISLLNTDKW